MGLKDIRAIKRHYERQPETLDIVVLQASTCTLLVLTDTDFILHINNYGISINKEEALYIAEDYGHLPALTSAIKMFRQSHFKVPRSHDTSIPQQSMAEVLIRP